MQSVACSRCNAGAPDGAPPLGWSITSGAGGTRLLCQACTRENLRSIEGQLDEAWW